MIINKTLCIYAKTVICFCFIETESKLLASKSGSANLTGLYKPGAPGLSKPSVPGLYKPVEASNLQSVR